MNLLLSTQARRPRDDANPRFPDFQLAQNFDEITFDMCSGCVDLPAVWEACRVLAGDEKRFSGRLAQTLYPFEDSLRAAVEEAILASSNFLK